MSSTGTISARYSYDPYGRATLASGTNLLSTKQYAGYYVYPTSGLYLTKYRAYNANGGRWLSRDPIAESGGINLYMYVGNDSMVEIDRLGLANGTKPKGNGDGGTAAAADNTNLLYSLHLSCPCGFHMEIDWDKWKEGRAEGLGGEIGPGLEPVSLAGGTAKVISTVGKDGARAAATVADKVLTPYELMVDIASYLRALRCIRDSGSLPFHRPPETYPGGHMPGPPPEVNDFYLNP